MAFFSTKVLDHYLDLPSGWPGPPEFEIIYPFDDDEVRRVMKAFFNQFYQDNMDRIFLFGINPGRFGAGVTGIPFTDAHQLERHCHISNSLDKRQELSSQFVYHMISAYGGPQLFYSRFYITSICPVGFLKDGKNANYYDDKKLEARLRPRIVSSMWQHISFGANRHIAFSIGQGKNYNVLRKLNAEHGFFERLVPLPHPRWVMQYRRKKIDTFVDEYRTKLNDALKI